MKQDCNNDPLDAMCNIVHTVFEAEVQASEKGGKELLQRIKDTSDQQVRDELGNQYIRLVAEQVIKMQTITINGV